MVSKTHTMTLGISKNNIFRILGTSYVPKQKQKTYLFFCDSNKTCIIVFEKTIYNIK